MNKKKSEERGIVDHGMRLLLEATGRGSACQGDQTQGEVGILAQLCSAGMTWTVSHTIPTSSTIFHDAFVYLFDTFLPSKTGSTTGPHPDANLYKRKWTRTTTNMFNGTPHTEYFWCSWGSTTPSTMTMYRDGTYTTTPGDLGTDTTNACATTLPTATAGDVRFWSSDQNPRAALVTKGKAVIFWEPGFTSLASYDRGIWTGTVATCIRSQVFPFMPSSAFGQRTGMPDTNGGTSTTEWTWGPAFGVTAVSNGYYGMTDRLDMNVPFMVYGQSSSPVPSTGGELMSPGVGNDTGLFRPASPSDTNRFIAATGSSATGLVLATGGRYYLLGRNTTSTFSLVWDMGTSEPSFS